MKVVSRHNEEYELRYSLIVRFLYNTFIGRVILKLLTKKFVSKIGALLKLRI